VAPLDIFALSQLTFVKPDRQKFRCLALAYEAMAKGGYACIALNASNEVAVQAFLAGQVRLTDIADINEQVLNQAQAQTINSLATILAVDKLSRQQAAACVDAICQPQTLP
jgi:1-deoxy-D-xylulose-5-phosphate reductoisomerase